jgi:hypothetical protein
MAPMDTTPLIDSLRQDLVRAAEVGGPDAKAAAERLLMAMEPAVRLTLMDALTQAAAELGGALPGVAIEVRLKGRDPEFVVVRASATPSDETDAGADAETDADVARITLRIPETLKARAETLAARRGQSLNTWLVSAARAAADENRSQEWSDWGRQGRSRRMQGWQK